MLNFHQLLLRSRRLRLVVGEPVLIGVGPENRFVPHGLDHCQGLLVKVPAGEAEVFHLVPEVFLHVVVELHQVLRRLFGGKGAVVLMAPAVVSQDVALGDDLLDQLRLAVGEVISNKKEPLYPFLLQRR